VNRIDNPRTETSRQVELRVAEALEQIPGVLAAAVSLSDPAQVREVYIAAAPHANLPSVQQAAAELLSREGLAFAPSSIQIGQIDEVATTGLRAEDPAPPAWQGRFLILGGLDIHRSGSQVTCKVQLLRLGETFDAEARELDTETGRARAAARATLAAAEQASSSARLGLEGAALVNLFGHNYVVVSVEATNARRFSHLCGILATDATRSIEEAACLATLRAVERWVAW
jgi:hypothetical protein